MISNYDYNVDGVVGGLPVAVNHIAGLTGNTMNFTGTDYGYGNATFDVNVSGTDFYLGLVENLAGGGDNNHWFDGGTASRPVDGTIVLAFGNNSIYTSNSVMLDFVPGVTAFGFNYDDIETATLDVEFTDTITGDIFSTTINPTSPEGFLSVVAGTGQTINSITLTQDPGSQNDGFTFYGFQTVQVIPLPPAAFAGLGLLGAMGVVRRLRNKA
ncbi:MAG: hypothetical protein WD114_06725 [Phycisphaerales bacterium]